MKNFMIPVAAVLFAATLNATPVSMVTPLTETTVQVIQDKVEVRIEDIPEAVKKTLAEPPLSDWKIERAFLVTGENETRHFEILLSKGEETTTVNLTKEGKVIE